MEYRVLARKYRPQTFADLVGQEVLVQTLSNAIAQGRVAHAFLLTGIRGIGKTTTARIIARALNCIGPDGQGQATISPCGVCTHCQMIAEDRHVDVLEMDAASRTGVGDIREIIETVRYLPASARYKIYIIDEVHMLSTSAFNALLKTLEEPPPHVKFIFATTEVRKIPVTVLSRCQRFDLKRLDAQALAAHLGRVAEKEGVALEAEALALISMVAEGSVRDGLSLLDQAIARFFAEQPVGAGKVREMLGLADKTQTLSLLEDLLESRPDAMLTRFRQMHAAGADPVSVLQDMLELVHFITHVKLTPESAQDVTYAEAARARALALASKLGIGALSRLWQLLLKGVGEVKSAPDAAMAAEMALVRVAFAAELPTPVDIIKRVEEGGSVPISPPKPVPVAPASALAPLPAPPAAMAPVAEVPQATPSLPKRVVADFAQAVECCQDAGEVMLYSSLMQFGSVVSFAAGDIALYMQAPVTRDFTARFAKVLEDATGMPWRIALNAAPGAPTLQEQKDTRQKQEIQHVQAEPLVASVLEHFPGAEVLSVKEAV